MTTIPTTPRSPLHEQNHKDACSYSVEVAKQFMTLASAGVAFVVALAIADAGQYRAWFIAALVLLGVSLFVGMAYIMNVVGNIHLSNDYDVYSPRLRWVATTQILLFLFALMVLGKLVWYRVRLAPEANPLPAITTIEVTTGGRTSRFAVPSGKNVAVTAKPTGEVNVALTPAR
jgi:hypothetical protein